MVFDMTKRNCKLLVTALILSILASLNPNGHVCACTCAPIRTASEELQSADYVFLGKVTSIIPLSFSSYSITFTVQEYWKGNRYKTITIHEYNCQLSPSLSAFFFGADYIVYARGEYPDISMNYCSRLIFANSIEEEIKELGLGQSPNLETPVYKHQNNSFYIIILLSSFFILALFIIVFLILRNKRIRSRNNRT
jgi:hypothetical protein